MSYKIFFFTLFLVFLMGVGGYLFLTAKKGASSPLWTFSPAKKEELNYALQEAEKKEEAELDARTYNAALETKDVLLCEKISDQTQVNRCRDMITVAKALENMDLTLCESLTDTGMTIQCQDNVHFRNAENENNATLCSAIHDENIEKNCLDIFATAKLKANIISGSFSADTCDELSTSDLQEKCRERLQTEIDNRIYREAIESKDVSRCDPIGDDTLRAKCRNILLLDQALIDGNLELCASITDIERANYCQSSLLARGDVSRYQEIIKKNDIEACKTLSVIQMQEQCHDTIVFSQVRTTQDDTLCMTLYNTGITDRCHAMIKK